MYCILGGESVRKWGLTGDKNIGIKNLLILSLSFNGIG
jgi:hypothetical protein